MLYINTDRFFRKLIFSISKIIFNIIEFITEIHFYTFKMFILYS